MSNVVPAEDNVANVLNIVSIDGVFVKKNNKKQWEKHLRKTFEKNIQRSQQPRQEKNLTHRKGIDAANATNCIKFIRIFLNADNFFPASLFEPLSLPLIVMYTNSVNPANMTKNPRTSIILFVDEAGHCLHLVLVPDRLYVVNPVPMQVPQRRHRT